MHRSVPVTLLVIGAALAAAPAAASEEPARLTPPIQANDATVEAPGATTVLENGTTEIAVSTTQASVEVYVLRQRCLEQDEETCMEGSWDENTRSVKPEGAITVSPREETDTHAMTGLVAGEDARVTVDAPEMSWALSPHNETRELVEDDRPDDRFRQVTLDRGAQIEAEDPTVTMEGSFELRTVDTTVRVPGNGSTEEIVTGWTWESSEDGVAYYRTLRLVHAQVVGATAVPWDAQATVATDLPAALTASEAVVDVQEGQLGPVNASDGPSTIEDAELTVEDIEWNETATTGEDYGPDGTPYAYQPDHPEGSAGWFEATSGAQAPPPPTPDEGSSATSVAVAGGAALATAALAAYYWPRITWAGAVLLGPLYSRIEKDEMLEHEVREDLYETVKDDPGIHAHALSEAADVGWGTTVYHLRRLEKSGFVKSEKKGRYRRFFPAAGYKDEHREVLSVLQNETTEAVAQAVLDDPGLNQSAICEAVDISPSLANWHLDQLIEADLVERERRGRTVHYTPGPAWEKVQGFVDLEADEAAVDGAAAA